jgi:hypothetical protein
MENLKITLDEEVKPNPKKIPHSTVDKLIDALGLEKVKEISLSYGTYSGARQLYALSGIYVPDSTILHMRKRFGWVRTISTKDDCNARSVINKKVPIDYFKTIKFSEDITNEVF